MVSKQKSERSTIERLRDFLFARKRAYQMVFHPDNEFTNLVMADLAKFCRAHASTFHVDPRAHAVLEGRREVFLRIANHLNLTTEQLVALYARKDNE